jgi:hypothetical protein
MSSFFRAIIVGVLTAAPALWAVYAPVQVQDPEPSKDFSISLKGGLAHDSNLFGAATSEIETAVWTLAPRGEYVGRFNGDRTFLVATYGLTLDQFDNRPGDKLLDSHDASVRAVHSFAKDDRILDINETLSVSRNPEALLAGVKLNTDQSYTRNQLDGSFDMNLAGRAAGKVKARSIYYDYRDAELGRALDRIENLYGVEANYQVQEKKLKAVAEYRHQDVYYTKLGETKNKRSDYLMAGANYDLDRKWSVEGRFGAEWRSRSGERSTVAPYFSVLGKWDYDEPKKSFLSGGFEYTLEETSDTARFNDTKALRGFVTIQHAVRSRLWASASLTYEPSTLQGRRGQVNIAERTLRSGVALTFLKDKDWSFSTSLDYDRVRSDDPGRKMTRLRGGVSALYTF